MKATCRSEARLISALVSAQSDTRRGLEGPLGLGKAAISVMTDRLIRQGIISEGAKMSLSARGRKSVALAVRPDLGYLIGTDLEGLAIRACVLNSAREMVISAKREVSSSSTPAGLLGQWEELLADMVHKAGIRRDRIAGIGAGLPGTLTPDRPATRAYLPPGQWVDLDATQALSRLNLPIVAANNVLCAADYERRLGAAAGKQSFLMVLARYGLGAALYGNCQFLVGDEAFTCELGHMRIDRNGPRCVCGRRGCLDALVSGRTLPPAGRRHGAVWERELSRRTAALGVGIANILKIFHPSLVVLDGVYSEYEESILPVLRSALKEELDGLGLSVPQLVIGDKVEFKASIGAALRAADCFMEPYLLAHVFRRAVERAKG